MRLRDNPVQTEVAVADCGGKHGARVGPRAGTETNRWVQWLNIG